MLEGKDELKPDIPTLWEVIVKLKLISNGYKIRNQGEQIS